MGVHLIKHFKQMGIMAEVENKDENGANQEPVVKKKSASQIANLKQLRVQSGALKRYTKELQLYMKELSDLKSELDQMRNENDDEKQKEQKKIKLKQQRQAIDETENVIRDIRPKLVKTWENVDSLMQDLKEVAGDEDDEKLLNDTKVFLENAEPLVNG